MLHAPISEEKIKRFDEIRQIKAPGNVEEYRKLSPEDQQLFQTWMKQKRQQDQAEMARLQAERETLAAARQGVYRQYGAPVARDVLSNLPASGQTNTAAAMPSSSRPAPKQPTRPAVK